MHTGGSGMHSVEERYNMVHCIIYIELYFAQSVVQTSSVFCRMAGPW